MKRLARSRYPRLRACSESSFLGVLQRSNQWRLCSYVRSPTILPTCSIAFMIFLVLDGLSRTRVTDEEARNSCRIAGGSLVGHSGALGQLAPEREDDDQGQQEHANRHLRN